MFPWLEVIQMVAQGVIAAYYEPTFWMIIALVGYQYWQAQRTQLEMFGVREYNLSHQVMMALVYGSIGGIIGSFLMTIVGVSLNQLGFAYLWPVALVLMLIHVRFLCFAYAGGIVALSHLLFGWPEVNVSQLVGLVAVLHMTESVLIAISGRFGAAPVILRREDGRLVGAFTLQNFWPLPLVAMAAVIIPGDASQAGGLSMPNWWPLLPLGLEAPEGKQWLYVLVPVIAALGYSDVAISKLPRTKRGESALHLAMYSGLLLCLAILSAKFHWVQWLAGIASPAGHELLIQLDNKKEMRAEPRFVPPPDGVMILSVLPGSPGNDAGLRPGDILHRIAGWDIHNRFDLAEAITWAPPDFSVEYERNGRYKRKETGFYSGVRQLGVILVPNGDERYYMELSQKSFWFWNWVKRKWRRAG